MITLEHSRLLARLGYPADGYFCQSFFEHGRFLEVTLSPKIRRNVIDQLTVRLVGKLAKGPLLCFTDGIAGWKHFKRTDRILQVDSASDISRVLSLMHFRSRSRLADNYYLSSAPDEWIIMYCHEGDWHLWAIPRIFRHVLSSVRDAL